MSAPDEDEWIDLDRSRYPDRVKPDVTLRLSRMRVARGVSAWIALRHDVGESVLAAGPRFKVQIGGSQLNKIRITADAMRGTYEVHEFKGVARICLGHVNLWPNEERAPVSCEWSGKPGAGLVLTLPASFAKPAPKPSVPPEVPSAARIIDRRPTVGAVSLGEPPAGRSALDQRRGVTK